MARRTIKSFHRIQGEKSKFVLLEFINFELVLQCESEKSQERIKALLVALIMIVLSD